MPDRSQLPHLLNLLSDDSPEIRREVRTQLEAFGDDLPEALAELDETPDEAIQPELERLLNRIAGRLTELAPRQYHAGQLVRHRRYGYRGVVVGFDLSCQADESWYQTNRTQPDRSQPWYHVLVHQTPQVTYAAQTSLEPDPLSEPIVHPMLDAFFSGFSEGRYIRNDRPWPFA